MSQKAVSNGSVVSFSFKLTSTKGEVLDAADSKDPMVYLHGAQQIIPGLEKALTGLKKGDKTTVKVTPKEGYGEVDPALKMSVDKSNFPKDFEFTTGSQFETETKSGDVLVFTIEGVKGDKVMIDGNHPLAGQTLNFDVEVEEVRDATKEEMAHGHAHGPGGHHVH